MLGTFGITASRDELLSSYKRDVAAAKRGAAVLRSWRIIEFAALRAARLHKEADENVAFTSTIASQLLVEAEAANSVADAALAAHTAGKAVGVSAAAESALFASARTARNARNAAKRDASRAASHSAEAVADAAAAAAVAQAAIAALSAHPHPPPPVSHYLSDESLASLVGEVDTEAVAKLLEWAQNVVPEGCTVLSFDHFDAILRRWRQAPVAANDHRVRHDASDVASDGLGRRHIAGQVYGIGHVGGNHYVEFKIDHGRQAIRIVDPLARTGQYETRARAAADALNHWQRREQIRLRIAESPVLYSIETNYANNAGDVEIWAMGVTQQPDAITCSDLCNTYILFDAIALRLPTTVDILQGHAFVLRLITYHACMTGSLRLVLPVKVVAPTAVVAPAALHIIAHEGERAWGIVSSPARRSCPRARAPQ